MKLYTPFLPYTFRTTFHRHLWEYKHRLFRFHAVSQYAYPDLNIAYLFQFDPAYKEDKSIRELIPYLYENLKKGQNATIISEQKDNASIHSSRCCQTCCQLQQTIPAVMHKIKLKKKPKQEEFEILL